MIPGVVRGHILIHEIEKMKYGYKSESFSKAPGTYVHPKLSIGDLPLRKSLFYGKRSI